MKDVGERSEPLQGGRLLPGLTSILSLVLLVCERPHYSQQNQHRSRLLNSYESCYIHAVLFLLCL